MTKSLVCVFFCSFLCALLLMMPAHAVDVYKVSQYGEGHQIWFEAEAFDGRDAESARGKGIGFQLAGVEARGGLPKDAFGGAIVNVKGTDTVWIRYDFDISAAGGEAGTWYLWARMINPGGRSEWLWVLGDDGDEVPQAVPVCTDADDRVFESVVGPPWGWASRKTEGDVKKLKDGMNTMAIFYREGDSTNIRDTLMWADSTSYKPTDADYIKAEEISNLSVAPKGKLTTTWGMLKAEY